MKTLTSLCMIAVLAWSAQGADPSPGALLRRISTIRLEIAGGRITCPTLSSAANRTFSEDRGEIKESLSINPSSNEPSLLYRYLSPERELTFDLQSDGSVRLQDKIASETLVLEQFAGRPLKLMIQASSGPKREITARTLWHWLVFSQEARDALVPRFDVLRPDWDLAKQGSEIRGLLVESTHPGWAERRAVWQKCVDQLGDSDYQVRQMADRTLRSGGAAAAAFLEWIDDAQLNREQSRRVARIIANAARDIDEPGAVASAWSFDAEVWCHLLQDNEAATRTLAADHLAQLLGRPLVFDPSATRPIRSAQARVIEDTLIRR